MGEVNLPGRARVAEEVDAISCRVIISSDGTSVLPRCLARRPGLIRLAAPWHERAGAHGLDRLISLIQRDVSETDHSDVRPRF